MFTATIGFFDGVHNGHRCLIEQLTRLAAQRNEQAMIITFDVHPRQVVQTCYVPQLLTLPEEKTALLNETGVDSVVMLNFTREMSLLSSSEFMKMLHDDYDVDCLLMGYDHHFGHDGGDIADYVERGRKVGIEVLQATELEEEKVSSRIIRNLIDDGDILKANELLGYEFRVTAPVVHGHEVGRSLGFPTANLSWPEGKILPEEGVYAAWATLPDGTRLKAMLNIGCRPTINNGENVTVEVHILDFDGELYGLSLTIDFVAKLRDEMRFESKQALIKQLRADAAIVKQAMEEEE